MVLSTARNAFATGLRKASSAIKQGSTPAQFSRIKEKQKAWAVDNGLRVHERGNTDKVMMFASQTLLVCFHDNFILEIACIELNTGCWWSSLAAGGLQDGLPKGILEIAQFLLFFLFLKSVVPTCNFSGLAVQYCNSTVTDGLRS